MSTHRDPPVPPRDPGPIDLLQHRVTGTWDSQPSAAGGAQTGMNSHVNGAQRLYLPLAIVKQGCDTPAGPAAGSLVLGTFVVQSVNLLDPELRNEIEQVDWDRVRRIFEKLGDGKLITKPRWDATEPALYWDRFVIKRFDRRAFAQEAILSQFERLGWPDWIKSPLKPDPFDDPKVHLNKTIDNLNHQPPLKWVRFHSHLNGTAIRWCLASIGNGISPRLG